MTHEQACRAVAAWFLSQRWCGVATWEIAGRVTGHPYQWPPPPLTAEEREHHARAAREHQAHWSRGGGVLDVLAVSGPDARRPRVAIAEVKVSAADLAADLRAGKMRRYQPQASECWLAVAESVAPGMRKVPVDEIVERLGVLPGWGLLWVGEGHGSVWMLRRPTGHELAHQPTPESVAARWRDIARNLAYRALRDPILPLRADYGTGTGPIGDEPSVESRSRSGEAGSTLPPAFTTSCDPP